MSPGAQAASPRAPTAVDIGAIDRELTQLWNQSGAGAEGAESMTRACMSNLIIFCSERQQADVVSAEVADIVQQHPSRVVLLIAEGGDKSSDVEAYVAAQCHVAGSGKQICSEHVTVTTSGSGARRLPSVARPLLIGDLPTALWWASAQTPSLDSELFPELAAMADHVIYDSVGWPDAARGVVSIADWAAQVRAGQVVSDIAWRRLKPWRRLIGQALDPAVAPGALQSISDVVVDHGPHALPQAWLLIGWLACRLGWRSVGGKVAPGVEVTWAFQSDHGPLRATVRRLGEGESEVHKTSITWKTSGRSSTLSIGVVGAGRLAVNNEGTAGAARVLASPVQPRAMLVARQLPDLGRDRLFADTLQVARTMAKALL